ncbi:MAG TPA: hypothetical protein VGN23_08730 [Verrucomicrobiae bacterium]|jgi:hypothetical protein
MKLPADSKITDAKVTEYLLKLRDEDDKSKFLSRAGYTAACAGQLLQDLRNLLSIEANFVQKTDYGDKYRICGTLSGPNGCKLRVISIWMIERATGKTKFVTLYPDKNEI